MAFNFFRSRDTGSATHAEDFIALGGRHLRMISDGSPVLDGLRIYL